MKARTIVGVILSLIGLAGIWFGVMGWTQKRELVDESFIELSVTERETSPLLAALGGIALATGLFALWAARDRTPV